jgi:hypothetical protein
MTRVRAVLAILSVAFIVMVGSCVGPFMVAAAPYALAAR